MKKIVIKYGIIGGIFSGIMFYWNALFGGGEVDFDKGEMIGYATMIVALTTVFFGTKSFRDKHQAGIITFGKAFQVGIFITLIACAIYVLSWMLYYSFGDGQEVMAKYVEYSIQKMQDSGTDAKAISDFRKQMDDFSEMYKNPLVRIGFTFMEILPVGLVITLISSFILKRGPKEV